MKNLYLLLLGMACACATMAQTVKVVDRTTRSPLPEVLIYTTDQTKSTTTNAKGVAAVSAFNGADSIHFRYMSYKERVLSFKQLETNGYLVELTEDNIALGEVVVTSSRWEVDKRETAGRIEKIKPKEVFFQNPQTAADLLGLSGYVFIQKSQMGGGSPMLRGMATNRVLLVVDGVRMNTAIFRAGNLQNVISIDANSLQSTEVMFGPGSLMYGSDAIGGVMNFQTLAPKFSGADAKVPEISGNALTRFSSANMEKTGHIDFNIGLKKLAFTTSLTYSDYGDLRSGTVGGDNYFYRSQYVETIDTVDYMVTNNDSALQVGSKYSQINLMQKVRYRPTQHWDLEYGFHFSETSDFGRYDRLYVKRTSGPNQGKLRWAEWYYGPQKWQMHRLVITHSKSNVVFDNARLIAAYQFFEESRFDREFNNRIRNMQLENVHAFSVNIDFEKKISAPLTVNYGLEAVHNTVRSVGAEEHIISNEITAAQSRYPDGSTWQSYGAYLSAKYRPHPKLTLNAGVRYNHFVINADFDTTFLPLPFTSAQLNRGAVNGSLGLVYSPLRSRSWLWYLNGASGFRAPNIDDMGKVFESTPGYLVVPNANLRPEQVVNLELGTVKSFGSFLKVDVTGYYTWLFDAMVRNNATFNGDTMLLFQGNESRVQSVQNVTQIQVYGIQAGIEFSMKGIGLRSEISYQHGREQTADSLVYYPLRHAAPWFGSTHLTYDHKRFRLDFYVLYNGAMQFDDLALTERINASYAKDEAGRNYSAAWYTLNFKAAVYLNSNVAISAGIENITDRLYRPFASGINAPGRNVIASLSAKF